jgi:hypothetical protein
MGEDKITIASVATEYGISAADVKRILGLSKFMKADSELNIEQVAFIDSYSKSGSAEKKAQSSRVFYWIEGRNIEFLVNGALYASKQSVLKLDSSKDAEAIKYLEKHKDNEKNGGRIFAELSNEISTEEDSGKFVDKLLTMSVDQLAEMVGGGIANRRRSKGSLINEIVKNS